MSDDARAHFESGRLAEAIAAATREVKSRPTDQEARGLLAELLCLAGELERADRQLDVLGGQSPELLPGIVLFRHIIRAEQARAAFYDSGSVPEFLEEPGEHLRLCLRASIAIREGNPAEAAALLAETEEKRPKPSGTCNGERFDDLRDLDDLTAGVFEVLTGNGDYYWIPTDRVEHVEFKRPARPRDLLWRRASMTVRGGPDGEVYLPAIYAGSLEQEDERLRLGRATDWQASDAGPVRGIGLRSFLIGEDDRTIMELEELAFDEPQG